MKGVLLIIDGLGDLPVGSLHGQTPLEAASTPVLDSMAAAGQFGLVDPVKKGETPNTHSGVGPLMGLAPGSARQLRRGPVEAAGLGVVLGSGDVALRVNFATVRQTGNGLVVIDRRAGRISEGTEDLAAEFEDMDLGDGVTATLRPTEQHRGVLVLSGAGLNPEVSDADPGNRELPVALPECRALEPGAELTASLINRFVRTAHHRLEDHPVNQRRKAAGLLPANGVLTRGAGRAVALDNIVHESGLRASVIAGCNTVRGLGSLFGFDIVRDHRFTGCVDTDLDAKIASAISQLVDHDLVFVHIKAPDICAHDLRPLAKRDFIQRLDAALPPLTELDIKVALTADHTTDSNTGLHTADPVPALVYLAGQPLSGAVAGFGETSCREGNMPRQTGHRFLLDFLRATRN